MPRFEINKPSKVKMEKKPSERYVWIYHRLTDGETERYSLQQRTIEFIEEKLETEGLAFVMGTPDMKEWLFKWVR